MSNLEKFIENPTSSEYVTELNRLNYIFRRKTAFKVVENTADRFTIEIFGLSFTIEHDGYSKLPPISISKQVEYLILQAYSNFVMSERRTSIHPSYKKIPKSIRFAGKNFKLAEIKRLIEIQIAKNIPLSKKACKYYGIKYTFWDIYQLSKLPEFAFEMEPAYVLMLTKLDPDLKFKNKQELYKFVNNYIDNSEVIKILPTLTCTVARRFVSILDGVVIDKYSDNGITLSSELCKLLKGSPKFNICILNLFGYKIEFLTDAIKIAAEYSKKKGKSNYTVQKFEEIRDWLIQTGTKLDKNQKKRGFEYLVKKSDEWHEEVLRQKENLLKKVSWQPVLGDFEIGDVKIRELSDSSALFFEGQNMKHCVGSYSNHCASYNSVIFNISDSKNSATAEFRIVEKTSSLAQIRGKYNAQIQPKSSLYKAAVKISSKLNKKLKDFEFPKLTISNQGTEEVPF